MINAHGYAALAEKKPLELFHFDRREVGTHDVLIDILYCGICHSDIHQARNEWKTGMYPMVPGHEIIGRVSKVGNDVKKTQVGDLVGVGCMVNSCRTCATCKKDLEQFCEHGATFTYNSMESDDTHYTFGGYSNCIVVKETFVLSISEKLDPASTAPLLCAGITTYSPLKKWGAGPGKKVGVIGLGGLGHMGIQFARAMGAHVVLFTTSASKVDDALQLGAHEVILSKNKEDMEKHLNSFDLILDTVGSNHDLGAYLNTLTNEGVMILVGLPEEPQSLNLFPLVFSQRKLVGSAIGGIKETQEMLDYCAKHSISSHIEIIPIQKVNEAFERILKSDVKYRFVIDMSSLQK